MFYRNITFYNVRKKFGKILYILKYTLGNINTTKKNLSGCQLLPHARGLNIYPAKMLILSLAKNSVET